MPKGIVGIMAPWNYPLQLALLPAVDAIAAGNRVVLKPAEATPRTGGMVFHVLQERPAIRASSVKPPFEGRPGKKSGKRHKGKPIVNQSGKRSQDS